MTHSLGGNVAAETVEAPPTNSESARVRATPMARGRREGDMRLGSLTRQAEQAVSGRNLRGPHRSPGVKRLPLGGGLMRARTMRPLAAVASAALVLGAFVATP